MKCHVGLHILTSTCKHAVARTRVLLLQLLLHPRSELVFNINYTFEGCGVLRCASVMVLTAKSVIHVESTGSDAELLALGVN